MLLALVAASLGSMMAAYSYGRFSAAAQGESSFSLSPQGVATELDRKIGALQADHRNETGLTLVSANLDAFAARVLSVRAAGRSLDAMYYIWKDDLTGTFLLNELKAAAERGVRVRLLLDDIGINGLDKILRSLDAHPNVEVRLFNPTHSRENVIRRGFEMALRFASVNRRMHNKAWIADGQVAVVGGRNIGDAYFDADAETHFNDLDLLVTGPVLRETETLFDAFWNSRFALPIAALSRRNPMSSQELTAEFGERLASGALAPYLEQLTARASVFSLFDEDKIHWTTRARLLADPADKAAGKSGENWMMRDLAPILASAERALEITSPYFVPKDEGTRWLADISARGVAVSVLTNSLAATDVAAVHGGYAPFRAPLLEAGVRLFELRRSGQNDAFSLRGSTDASLHTKAFTVDDRLAFVGSLNFDPRSASLNTEMGVLFEVPELVGTVRALFAQETEPRHSYEVSLADGGELRWTGETDGRTVVLDQEPNASLARRLVAGVMSVLPLDSQL